MARPKVDRSTARVEAAESTVRYMMDGVRHVCETFKKRLPGSQPERDAQAFFKQELEGYADETIMEDFAVHPHAFMGFIPIAALCMLAAVGIYFFGGASVALAAVGAALAVFAALMFLFEFLFYRQMVDFLFPKRVSRNVYAVRKPSGEIKRRIIFGGHTDAAWEWTYSWLGEKTGLAIAIFGAVYGLVVSLAASICNAVYVIAARVMEGGLASKWQGGWLVWSILLLAAVPFAFAIMKFINYKVVVDGANDNLSANYIAMAVLKEMAESGLRFENTEVACLITGSEEAGLRGAWAFAKAHHDMLSGPEVETVCISLDTMREIEEMRICQFGCTGTVKNDLAVGDLLRDAGRACGVELPGTELYPGALDSEAFSILGLRATGFSAVSHDAKRYYHTRMDTPDNMDPDCLALSLNICKEAARLFDKEGMKGYDEKRKKK
ncbi:MAG: M28 family metallopeptidase [Firmicutes bacterium]|nr:M28 family metallopeptidase [Bacillota bacterium]